MSVRIDRALLLCLSSVLTVVACDDAEAPTAPQVVDQEADTAEDTPVMIDVLKDGGEPAGTPLTVTLAGSSEHGVEVIGGTAIKVTPKLNFHGMITVSYLVKNARLGTAARAVVTVRPVNDAPVATGGTVMVGRRKTLDLMAQDVDGDPLRYELVTPPAHGSITGAPPTLQYTAGPGFLGDDQLVYRVTDGMLTSAPATLRLTVIGNSAPSGRSEIVSAREDEPHDFVLRGTDPDDDPLRFTLITAPSHGTLDGAPPSLRYTSVGDFHGSDFLEFSVSDGTLSSSVVRLTINVAPTNDPPIATAQSLDVVEDGSLQIFLAGSDIDGDPLTFEIATQPSHGFFSGSAVDRFYNPFSFYHGPDSFTFVAFDGVARSAPVTVSINVQDNNRPPEANPLSRTVIEDSSVQITLSGSDPDGSTFLTFAISTPPTHGTVSGSPPTVRYTPDADYSGSDSFAYTAFDGTATSTPATVNISVTPSLDSPVAIDASVTTAEDTQVAITLQGTDVDSTALTFTVLAQPPGGTITGTGANRTFTPAANATGTTSFLFTVSDGNDSDTGTITIHITPVDDPPTPRDDYLATDPGTPLTFQALSNDSDIDGDSVTLDSVAAPGHGTIEMAGGQLTYTPDPGFDGVEVFDYTIADSDGTPATGTIHIGVGSFPEGAPTEVIVAAGGTPSNDSRRAPAISRDGRYLAFTSALQLVASDTNSFQDVYLYDRGTRTLSRASAAAGGGSGNGTSLRPHLSIDGRYVVFESTSSNLVAGDTNGVVDVFRHDRVTGTTIRVSVATGGAQVTGGSLDAEISDDGNVVAFTSTAFDLVASDANGASDVFVRDLAADTTARISISFIGGDGDLGASEPALSGDGGHVAFRSLATNLVAGDTNGVADVFVRDRVAGTTSRVSVTSTGGEANGASSGPSVSRDGGFLSFTSAATNLVPGITLPGRPYVRDRNAQTTTGSASAAVWTRLSGTGRYQVLMSSDFGGGVSIRDRFANTVTTPPGAATWFWPAISSHGRYVVVLGSNGDLIVTPNAP